MVIKLFIIIFCFIFVSTHSKDIAEYKLGLIVRSNLNNDIYIIELQDSLLNKSTINIDKINNDNIKGVYFIYQDTIIRDFYAISKEFKNLNFNSCDLFAFVLADFDLELPVLYDKEFYNKDSVYDNVSKSYGRIIYYTIRFKKHKIQVKYKGIKAKLNDYIFIDSYNLKEYLCD